MSPRYGLIPLLVLMSCSKPVTSENHLTTNNKPDSTEAVSWTNHPGDSLSYIGYIYRFEDNKSFYTDLYFLPDFNYDFYFDITEMGDSVIFEGEESKRVRIPLDKGAQYFDLRGLGNINIYNEENLKLTTGQFSHIEYFEDLLEGRFVAVFAVDDPDISDYVFCIGNPKNNLTTIHFSSHEDEKLESDLMDHLNLNPDLVWNISHYKLDDRFIYSTISADTTAFIIETANQSHRILYKSKSSEAIYGLTMVSREIYERPLMLAESGRPETDMTWSSLLIFNGTEYEASKDHRIR